MSIENKLLKDDLKVPDENNKSARALAMFSGFFYLNLVSFYFAKVYVTELAARSLLSAVTIPGLSLAASMLFVGLLAVGILSLPFLLSKKARPGKLGSGLSALAYAGVIGAFALGLLSFPVSFPAMAAFAILAALPVVALMVGRVLEAGIKGVGNWLSGLFKIGIDMPSRKPSSYNPFNDENVISVLELEDGVDASNGLLAEPGMAEPQEATFMPLRDMGDLPPTAGVDDAESLADKSEAEFDKVSNAGDSVSSGTPSV